MITSRITVYLCTATAVCVMVAHTAVADEDISPLKAVSLHGFIDARTGVRTQTDPNEGEMSLGETRLQIDLEYMGNTTVARLRTDLVSDAVAEDSRLDLEGGTGFLDLREAHLMFSPTDILDVKIGRQILTWGTGDLLFINDLFPKDWKSFFSGRDAEYLKAPSDALFLSLFPTFGNIDIAYMPRFDSDRYITGERLSYWNPMAGRLAGQDAIIEPLIPNEWLADDEIAFRFSRNVLGYELAAYYYSGYWKTPVGLDPDAMRPSFPALSVYGASLRGRLGSGIVSIEGGYYDSRNDTPGTDPGVPNSQTRGLIGYERELMSDLSIGLQYYIEHMMDHTAYVGSLSASSHPSGENRQVLTLRLTATAMNQNLTVSAFAYYSPTDKDAYLRPIVRYKITDSWLASCGANVFLGEDSHTFFGQFQDNNNIYCAVRRSF